MTPAIPWTGAPWTPRQWQADALPIIVSALRKGTRGIVAAIMGSGKSILQAELVWLAMHRRGDRAIVVSAPRQALVLQLASTISARVGTHEVGVYYSRRRQPNRPVIVTCAASMERLRLELQLQGRAVALVIVDEAHGSEAAQVRDVLPQLEPRCMVGFTATPFRSLPKETLSLWDTILYRYTLADALRDRVLVPMRHVRYEGTSPGTVNEECLGLIREHGRGPGIVSATCIDDAEAYAAWMAERGLATGAIHSRLSQRDRTQLLASLERGDLSSLVHVSLLAEGVDMPWLRWLCLRRRVGARVRFLQEVGRVLRVMQAEDQWGPKEEGIVMDPHLLLGRHGLTSADALGRAMEEAADELSRDRAAEQRELRDAEVVALDRLLAYLAEVRSLLEVGGIVQPSQVAPGGWQMVGVSERQVAAVKGASRLTRHIPAEYREPVKALVKVPWALTRGEASDLLDVLYGGARWARQAAARHRQPAYRLQWSRRALDGVVPPSAAEARQVKRMRA